MFQAILFATALSQDIGLSKLGAVITQPSFCTKWGEGWSPQMGCGLCFNGFQRALAMTSQVWPSFTPPNSSPKYLEVRHYHQVCNSNPCSWIPLFGMFSSPQVKDQTREFVLIDAKTKQETVLGCPFKGQYASSDTFYVTTNSLEYIVFTDSLQCSDLQCTKAMIYDFKQKRTIELGRLLNQDATLCKTTDDGICPVLRVFPSASGNQIAVLIQDDVFKKTVGFNSDPLSFTQNMIVYFLDARALLEGRPAVLAKQSLRVPKNVMTNILSYK
jgi:hypothetical protein